ncbi:MAG TPA: glycerol-3-phosphate 1-O-acyltransferase PlsY [Gemmatimonadales bacterium]|nr:glycerol-3-phosphate 1-O-acyltransferase PlsY [Gemmatimonadales bacterium]
MNLGLGALLLLGSYLCGAVPTSYLVAKWFRGIDLREHGSKNLGATNLYRTLGWKFALPVGVIDVAKGAIPVLLLGPRLPGVTLFPTLCGVMAVVGHVYSVFVGFKGGKGVATAAGMLLGLAPEALGVALIVWLVLVRSTGYVSLGSVVAAAVFPPADYLFHPGRRTLPALGLDVAVALFVIWRHRANIHRLLNGTESRFGRRGDTAPSRR